MKKTLMVTAALLVLVLASAGSADAKCGVGCLNHKLSKLSKSLKKAEEAITAQSQTIAQQSQALAMATGAQAQTGKEVKALYTCFGEVPLAEYGEPKEKIGYLFETKPGTVEQTTALDVPFEGEEVGAWFIADLCNTAETASAQAAHSVFPTAGGLSGLLSQTRLP
jgi:tagatose-1,6-bisphosphate aldolase non-catalytic subunit AgaZ/GatZ